MLNGLTGVLNGLTAVLNGLTAVLNGLHCCVERTPLCTFLPLKCRGRSQHDNIQKLVAMIIHEVESLDNHRSDNIDKLETQIQSIEQDLIAEGTIEQLRSILSSVTAGGCKADRDRMWNLAYRLWNFCVEVANKEEMNAEKLQLNVKLRQVAVDILLAAGDNPSVPASLAKVATLLHRTGVMWHKASAYEKAEACLAKAMQFCCKAKDDGEAGGMPRDIVCLMLDIHIARAKVAWDMSQKALVLSIISRAQQTLLPYGISRGEELSSLLLQFGRDLLHKDPESAAAATEAVSFLEKAHEVCIQAESVAGGDGDITLSKKLMSLAERVLRYLAGAKLQAGCFQEALSCADRSSDHPSLPFIKLRAFVGLGRYEAVEKELDIIRTSENGRLDLLLAALDVLFSTDSSKCLALGKSAFLKLVDGCMILHKLLIAALKALLTSESTPEKLDMALELTVNTHVLSFMKSEERLQLVEEIVAARRSVFILLWNRSVLKFSHSFDAAFDLSLSFVFSVVQHSFPRRTIELQSSVSKLACCMLKETVWKTKPRLFVC